MQRTARPWRAAVATTSLRHARERYVLSRTTSRAPAASASSSAAASCRERAAALVSVQSQVARARRTSCATRDFPAPGMPITSTTSPVRLRRPRCAAGRRRAARCSSAPSSQRRGAGGRPGGLGPTGAGHRDDVRPEAEHPRERDLGLGGAVRLRDLAQRRITGEPCRPAGPAERRVGDRARSRRRHSDRRGRREARRRRTRLSATCTAAIGACSRASSSCVRLTLHTPTRADETLVDEPGERTDGRRPRRPRVGSVEEVEVDRRGRRARRGSPRSRRGSSAPGRRGSSLRRSAPFRPSSRRALRATLRRARASERLVALVRPGGVEDGDARVDRSGDRLEGELPRSVGRRMQPSPTRSSSGRSQLIAPGRARGRTPRAARPRPRARVARTGGSGANGSSRTRPSSIDQSPADEAVDEERRPDLAALDHGRRDARRRARAAGRRGSARGCRSAGGGATGAGVVRRRKRRSREVVELAIELVAEPPDARAARARGRRLHSGSPSTARCPAGSRVRTRPGSGGRGGRRRSSPDEPSAPSHVRAGTNVPPAVCSRQTEDDGPVDEPGVRREPVPDEPGAPLLDAELGPPERARGAPGAIAAAPPRTPRGVPRRLRSRPPRRVRRAGAASSRDTALAIDPGVREVVGRADEVQRRPHERRLDDVPARDRARELRRRRTPSRRDQSPRYGDGGHCAWSPAVALDRLRDGQPVAPEEELPRERRAIELAERERSHGATIVRSDHRRRSSCRLFRADRETGPPDHAHLARRPGLRVRGASRRRPRSRRRRRMPPSRRTARAVRKARPRTVEVAFVKNGWIVRVERIVPKGATPQETALRELTQGPTKLERRRGIRTALPETARLRSLRGSARHVVRELLALDVRRWLGGDEAHAALADRGHARTARRQGARRRSRRRVASHDCAARRSTRHLARRDRREGLPLRRARRPAPA